MKRLPSERKSSPVSHLRVSRPGSRSAALVVATVLAFLAFPPVGLSSQPPGRKRSEDLLLLESEFARQWLPPGNP